MRPYPGDDMTWDSLAAMTPDQTRERGLFPGDFLPLPHVKQATGGQVFPNNQSAKAVLSDLY